MIVVPHPSGRRLFVEELRLWRAPHGGVWGVPDIAFMLGTASGDLRRYADREHLFVPYAWPGARGDVLTLADFRDPRAQRKVGATPEHPWWGWLCTAALHFDDDERGPRRAAVAWFRELALTQSVEALLVDDLAFLSFEGAPKALHEQQGEREVSSFAALDEEHISLQRLELRFDVDPGFDLAAFWRMADDAEVLAPPPDASAPVFSRARLDGPVLRNARYPDAEEQGFSALELAWIAESPTMSLADHLGAALARVRWHERARPFSGYL